jgi:PAS domain S-box-containing protein
MKINRLARINYPIRTASFAWGFVVVGLMLFERQAGFWAWALAGLTFLAYPHIAYGWARVAADGRRAEMHNLYLDPIVMGAWVGALGFPTWPSFAAIFATTLNNAVIRGFLGAVVALVLFASAALAWIVPMGFQRVSETSQLVTAFCFLGSLLYAGGVGVVAWSQNQRVRETRESLRESERRYRLITEHAGDLVAMVDRDGRWLYWSPSYERILAPDHLGAGGDAFRDLHEEDQFRVRGAVQVTVRSGESCRLRMRLHTTGGDVRRFETLVHPVHDEGGGISGAVLASRDVTELRDREEQLEVAYAAFERMAEGMMIANAAGRILTVNQSYCRITGYDALEVVGRQEQEFRSAMQPQSWWDDLYAEVLRAGYWSGTSWCRRRDGTVYREWRSVSAVRDRDGRTTHYVSLFRELDGNYSQAQSA